MFLEVPSTADIPQLHTAPNVNVHWLPRDGPRGIPGRYVLDAVKAASMPPGRFTAYVAGESELPATLRRHLIEQRRTAKSDITFLSYWNHGKASPG